MSENISDKSPFITLTSYPQAIGHADGDAFFASCEQAREPRLKGKPVVTGAERGIIASASYEAKAFGVTRGVSLWDARRMCPGLVVLPSDYETYSLYSERMFAIIRRFTPAVEEFSIDEAFFDLTGMRRVYRTSYPCIAAMIKSRIQEELGLSVSVGLSLTKTLAKICSRHRKPDGMTALPGYELHDFLGETPLERVCGFGPNTVALLNKRGVYNVLDYVTRPLRFADMLLGKIGRELWHELRGEAIYRVCPDKKEKHLTMSKSKTFSPSSGNKSLVKAHLMKNLESVFIKLRRHKLAAKDITVYLREADFSGGALAGSLDRHSASTLDFTALCAALFETLFKNGVSYRGTGVVLSDINTGGVDSKTLFDDTVRVDSFASISKAVDILNGDYGKYAVHLASTGEALADKRGHPRNRLPWRKAELLKGETPRKRLNIPLLKLEK